MQQGQSWVQDICDQKMDFSRSDRHFSLDRWQTIAPRQLFRHQDSNKEIHHQHNLHSNGR